MRASACRPGPRLRGARAGRIGGQNSIDSPICFQSETSVSLLRPTRGGRQRRAFTARPSGDGGDACARPWHLRAPPHFRRAGGGRRASLLLRETSCPRPRFPHHSIARHPQKPPAMRARAFGRDRNAPRRAVARSPVVSLGGGCGPGATGSRPVGRRELSPSSFRALSLAATRPANEKKNTNTLHASPKHDDTDTDN